MALEEGFFSAEDGERLFYRFQSASSPALPLLLLHGHGEHSGRYLKFFSRLENLRCAIAIFDLRGSGRSGGRRVYVSKFEEYLSDLSAFRDFLKARYQIQGPVRLFGHSLGGLIATAWAHQNQEAVERLILSSPLFGIPGAGTFRTFVKGLDRLAPRLMILNPVKPPFLTHDPVEVEKYRKDAMIQRRITVRLVHEMLRYTSFFQKERLSLSFPVYILMAGDDRVVDAKATRRVFERLQAPEKELESFDGFYHEIFNELGQEKAFERLRHYLGR